MPITIGSNLASLQAQRRLGEATSKLGKMFEQLSSGLRINSASDDAAGLAIAETLRADQRVVTQGIRNINDAISFANVADGALQQLSDITIRQKELAEQSANGVLSLSQRRALNAESDALTDEYNRIITSTTFNGIMIFQDGAQTNLQVQAGSGEYASLTATLGTSLQRVAGDGTFLGAGTLATSTTSVFGTSADLNADGKLDLIFSGATGLQVRLGNGDGTFIAETLVATSSTTTNVVAADLNGDGKLDLATSISGAVAIAFGNGNGSFAAITTFAAPTGRDLHVADINGDGKLDLVNAQTGVGGFSIFYGNGNGTFQTAVSVLTGTSAPGLSVDIGDFNNDGRLDIMHGGGTPIVPIGYVYQYLQNADGTFTQSTMIYVGNTAVPGDITHDDYNHDGISDFVVTDARFGLLTISFGKEDGTFTRSLVSTTANQAAAFGDFNGDGYTDLLRGGGTNRMVMLNSGTGTFQFGQSISSSSVGVVADYNGDGALDLALTGGASVQLMLGNAKAYSTIGKVNLSSRGGAQNALVSLHSQLNRITSERANIGAFQNRLDVAANFLRSLGENEGAAESSLRNVDIAEVAAGLVRTQILQQAAASVLAHADHQPEIVLQLLR